MPASTGRVFCGFILLIQEENEHKGINVPEICPSYFGGITVRVFLFDKMIPGMLDPEMIEDTAKIVNEAQKDTAHVNLIINNRAGGNAPLIAQKIADRFHRENQQILL